MATRSGSLKGLRLVQPPAPVELPRRPTIASRIQTWFDSLRLWQVYALGVAIVAAMGLGGALALCWVFGTTL